MITVTKQYRAEIAHRLPNHPGKCKFLHGHEYLFEITVKASRNHLTTDIQEVDEETGMVLDFKCLKSIIEEVVGPWDHSLILWAQDPLTYILADYCKRDDGINLILLSDIPTAENMAVEIACQMSAKLAGTYTQIQSVKVWETTTSFAEWRA